MKRPMLVEMIADTFPQFVQLARMDHFFRTKEDPGLETGIFMAIPGYMVFLGKIFVCSFKGHPMTQNDSSIGPDSGIEDMSCVCGLNHFHHVYY